MTLKNYFNILETQQTSSIKEIKSAFKKCLLKYHPDKVDQTNTEALKKANQKTAQIIEAYEYLKKNIIYIDPFEEAISEVEISWDVRVGIDSSNIEWVEYYKELYILLVQFKSGGLYLYENVDYDTYMKLMQSPSKGKYLNKYIAYKFMYHKFSKYEEWYKFGKDIFYKKLNK